MKTIAIFYASRDGQTQKITAKLANHLATHRADCKIFDLARGDDIDGQDRFDIVVVIAAIRYGRPLRLAEKFLKTHRDLIKRKDLVLLSVNLTARKPEKRTPAGSVYLRKWIARHNLAPAFAASIAGKLDYQRYGIFDRFMIRLIMTMTKGPTNPDACIEFTDWDQVKEIADRIAALR